MKILITGAGSPLGQSIAKAAIIADLDIEIFIGDHSDSAPGFRAFNLQNVVTPSVAKQEYKEFMSNFIVDNQIDFVVPTISPEFVFFGNNVELWESMGCKILMNDFACQSLADDKYSSIKSLESAGFRVPYTRKASEFEYEIEFPLVIKPRTGASGKSVHVVKNANEFESVLFNADLDKYVVQEYMPGDEFTVGVLLRGNEGFALNIRRILNFGLSYTGEIFPDSEIENYAIAISKHFNLNFGSNIQLKVKDDKPVLFEINPRFSSTASVRAHFGFNELEFILRRELKLTPNEITKSSSGKFGRYWEEVYYD